DLVADPDMGVRQAAALALGSLGPAAATPETLHRLLDLVADPNAWVRRAAAEALGRLGPAAATPETLHRLLDLAHDPDSGVRVELVETLARLGRTVAVGEVAKFQTPNIPNVQETKSRDRVRLSGEAPNAPHEPVTKADIVVKLVEFWQHRLTDTRTF